VECPFHAGLGPPGTEPSRRVARSIEIECSPDHGAPGRIREHLRRRPHRPGVFEEIHDESLWSRVLREGDPAKNEAPASEVERSRALGVIDEGRREEAGGAQAKGVPAVWSCEDDAAAVEEAAHELFISISRWHGANNELGLHVGRWSAAIRLRRRYVFRPGVPSISAHMSARRVGPMAMRQA
jgi:hypothetical protein